MASDSCFFSGLRMDSAFPPELPLFGKILLQPTREQARHDRTKLFHVVPSDLSKFSLSFSAS